MKIAFRTDASMLIGSGHVMRCLNLADALKALGAQCYFICREQPGHLNDLIRQRGFAVAGLPAESTWPKLAPQDPSDLTQEPAHAHWLGCNWQSDAQQTRAILFTLQPSWIVVDHYALGQCWEAALRPYYQKMMVIDDLADRRHDCDLLVDQNWFGGETTQRYIGLLPAHCKSFLGPEYALLGPEYSQLRSSMPPRDGRVRQVLVFLGGSDPTNQTGKVLTALMHPSLEHLIVQVVLGPNHPAPESIAAQVAARSGTKMHQGLPRGA